MKIAAIAVLLVVVLLLLVAAIGAAPWLFVPLLVGVLTAWLFMKSPSWVWLKKALVVTKVLAGAAALALVVWLFMSTRAPSADQSVASAMNTHLARVSGTRTVATASSGLTPLEQRRLDLATAFQLEREKLQLIEQGLALNAVARPRYQHLETEGHRDENLEGASLAFETAYKKKQAVAPGKELMLLDKAQLSQYVQIVHQKIDGLEADDLAKGTDEQALRDAIQNIPGELVTFDIDALYQAETTLQQRLKDSLQMRLATDVTYSASYNRDADALVDRQQVRIRLADSSAASIDLTGFFTSGQRQLGADVTEDVSVREDTGPESVIDPKRNFVYPLRPHVQELTVVKSVTRGRAAEPALPGRLPVQLSLVRVDWPLSRTSSVTLALHDASGTDWPFVVPIETPDTASLARITMPRDAVIHVEPAMTPTPSASGDELTPGAAAGNLRRLAPGSPDIIRVELLPSYLSNVVGQKFKDYLAVENLWAALVVWGLTIGLFAVFKKIDT